VFIVGVENEDAGLPYSYVVFNCDKYKNKWRKISTAWSINLWWLMSSESQLNNKISNIDFSKHKDTHTTISQMMMILTIWALKKHKHTYIGPLNKHFGFSMPN